MTQLVAALVVILVLISSCTGKPGTQPSGMPVGQPGVEPTHVPVPTVIEPGLAYGQPCKPPCWRGITPGRSSAYDAEQAISDLRASGWSSRIDGGPSEGYSIEPGAIRVWIENGRVTNVSGQVTFYYSIGSMVAQFGAPEALYLPGAGSVAMTTCEEWVPPDPPTLPVQSTPAHILYPRQGLWFLILIPDSAAGLICPPMRATAFCYFAPSDVRDVLRNGAEGDICTRIFANITVGDLVKWTGFGAGY